LALGLDWHALCSCIYSRGCSNKTTGISGNEKVTNVMISLITDWLIGWQRRRLCLYLKPFSATHYFIVLIITIAVLSS
jgi:hypothetical protein